MVLLLLNSSIVASSRLHRSHAIPAQIHARQQIGAARV
jgi:hypothetical protein